MTQKHKWLLAGILVTAIFFRFYLIAEMPGGLFPDEAANGLDVNLMQSGRLQPFYERGNGREALFFYMLWGSVELFGKGPWQHHTVSALIGVLSVLACFLVTKKLFSLSGKTVKSASLLGLLAGFFMAVSAWHVALSRTAFRAILIPLFTALTIYFALCAYQAVGRKKQIFWAMMSGATFALGFYTYIAYRIMVPILFAAVLWPFVADCFKKPKAQAAKKLVLPAALALIMFLAAIFPLARYFYTHPGSFVGRSGQVSIFNPDLNQGRLLSTALEVGKQSFLAYFTRGDLNWRHNISGQPFLSPLLSPFFAIGLFLVTVLGIIYVFKPKKRPEFWPYFVLCLWFYGMLLPVVTTAEGIPHGLRSIGTIPAVFIITALGVYETAGVIKKIIAKRHETASALRRAIVRTALKILAAAFVLALILQTYFAYFVYAYNSPENFYAFRSDLTTVSNYLNAYGNKNNTYLILDKFSVQTPEYLTSVDGKRPDNPKNQPYVQVDPEDSWKLLNLKHGDKLVFTQSSLFDIKKFKAFHPEARLVLEARNRFGQTVMAVYGIN